MPKIKYYYDPDTCKYEPLKTTTKYVIFDSIMMVSMILVAAFSVVIVYMTYFDSPKEKILRTENEKLHFYFSLLKKDMNRYDQTLSMLQDRDDHIYRTIFEQDPIPESIRNAGIGGVDRYADVLEEDLEDEGLVLNFLKKADQLKRQMYIQTKSYDEILNLADNQHLMLASIPAITPISTTQSHLSSGFGRRLHPIYKVWKLHTGIDFGARVGTPVHATGAGVVTKISTSFSGYGRQIEIDHGFGFVTKYAHLSEFNVKMGQKVKRGECIGFSGNTGSSTGPHLHYEIIKNKKKVNPIHYIYQDITEEEYEMMLKLASVENESM